MTAVPVPKSSWVDGVDALDSTTLTAYINDPLTFLLNRPAAQVRQAVAQTLATATYTATTFTAEDLDDDPAGTAGHSTSSNTSRYTAVYPGWYECTGMISFAGSATGRRGTRWAVNGSVVNASAILEAAGSASTISVSAASMLVYLDVGDYLELQAFQESGGNLDTVVTSGSQSRMTATWARLAA